MSALYSFYTLLLTEEVKERIKQKIKEVKECNEWSYFNTGVSTESLNIITLNFQELEEEKCMWENVAKLSINLMNDFDFFSQFSFENQFTAPIYKDLLENLGYICESGKWKCVRKPMSSFVLSNIFIYCLYQTTYDKMKKNENCEVLSAPLKCFFCGYKIKGRENKCNDCNSTIEEIILQQNIKYYRKEKYLSIQEDSTRVVAKVTSKNYDSDKESSVPEVIKKDNVDDERSLCLVEDDESIIRERVIAFEEDDVISVISEEDNDNDDMVAVKESGFKNELENCREETVNDECEDEQLVETLSPSSSLTSLSSTEGLFCPCFRQELNDLELKFYSTKTTEPQPSPPEEKWICRMCTFHNYFKNNKCEVCYNDSPHKNKWRCESCTFVNEINTPKCLVCHKINENVAMSSSRALVNPSINLSPRPMIVRKPIRARGRRRPYNNARPQIWICYYCNESNDDSLDMCHSCENER